MTDKPLKKDLPKAQPLDPEADKREARLAAQANRAFDAEMYEIKPLSRKDQKFHGVPMDEKLDPEKVEEYCQREPWILTELKDVPTGTKFGIITARFEHLLNKAEADGDSDAAYEYRRAMSTARRIYFEQLRKDFRILQSSMDRSAIGHFAQRLWVNVTRDVEKEGSAIGRFVGIDAHGKMDDELKDLARKTIYANTKWLALNINEIPVGKESKGPRPTIH